MKTAKIQTTVEVLEKIIDAAKRAQKRDDSLSTTLELEVTHECDTHLGSDMVGVTLKSAYQECNGEVVFHHYI
jgi:hypothetical protein